MSDPHPERGERRAEFRKEFRKDKRSLFERILEFLSHGPDSKDELIRSLAEAEDRELIEPESRLMLEGVLRMADMTAGDVMVAAPRMDQLDIDWPYERLLGVVIETAHSRFPVYEGQRDNVIGILMAKDLLKLQRAPELNLRTLLRPAVFVPESKGLNDLLRAFRINRNHLAIVVDEFGRTAGLITIEDVLEEIVGEIDDEHDIDDDSAFIRSQGDSFIVKALTPVEDFNEYFQATLSDERADTVGGLVMMELGRLPKGGETVDLDRFHFRVLRADNRRIHLLETSLHDGQEAAPPATENS